MEASRTLRQEVYWCDNVLMFVLALTCQQTVANFAGKAAEEAAEAAAASASAAMEATQAWPEWLVAGAEAWPEWLVARAQASGAQAWPGWLVAGAQAWPEWLVARAQAMDMGGPQARLPHRTSHEDNKHFWKDTLHWVWSTYSPCIIRWSNRHWRTRTVEDTGDSMTDAWEDA